MCLGHNILYKILKRRIPEPPHLTLKFVYMLKTVVQTDMEQRLGSKLGKGYLSGYVSLLITFIQAQLAGNTGLNEVQYESTLTGEI